MYLPLAEPANNTKTEIIGEEVSVLFSAVALQCPILWAGRAGARGDVTASGDPDLDTTHFPAYNCTQPTKIQYNI
jgi:hypothetical protein